jgi:hypothetical protein
VQTSIVHAAGVQFLIPCTEFHSETEGFSSVYGLLFFSGYGLFDLRKSGEKIDEFLNEVRAHSFFSCKIFSNPIGIYGSSSRRRKQQLFLEC